LRVSQSERFWHEQGLYEMECKSRAKVSSVMRFSCSNIAMAELPSFLINKKGRFPPMIEESGLTASLYGWINDQLRPPPC